MNISEGTVSLFDASGIPVGAVLDLSTEDIAWFERTAQRIDELLNDRDGDAGAPKGAPVVFLDMDDVVCLSHLHGGRAAIDAVRGKRIDAQDVFDTLMHAPAIDVLRSAHDAVGGRVRYVISSTWRLHANRSELAEILRRAGLSFVAANLEDRVRWATPDWSADGRSRLNEIAEWLRLNGRGEPFVVLDDTFSGKSLVRSSTGPRSPFNGCIVICQEEVGLLPGHADVIATALRMPFTLPVAE